MHSTHPFFVSPNHLDLRTLQGACGDDPERAEALICRLENPHQTDMVPQVREGLIGVYRRLHPNGRALLLKQAFRLGDKRLLQALRVHRFPHEPWPWQSVVEQGLASGWDSLDYVVPSDMASADTFGLTPLSALLLYKRLNESQRVSGLTALIDMGADPNLHDNFTGSERLPISMAIELGSYPATALLLQAGSHVPQDGLNILMRALAYWAKCDLVPIGLDWATLESFQGTPETATLREESAWFACLWRLLVEAGVDPERSAEGEPAPLIQLQVQRPDWAAAWEVHCLSHQLQQSVCNPPSPPRPRL